MPPAQLSSALAFRVLASFRITVAPHGVPVSFGLDVEPLLGKGDSGSIREDLTDLFVAAGEAARESGRAVVLAIDEIQYLSDEVFRGLIVGLHRCMQLELPIVAVGTGLPNVRGKAGDVKTYAERLFQFPEIGSLHVDDASRALIAPAERAGVRYEDRAVAAIVNQSKGYPYFLQEWGFAVWDAGLDSVISLETVERATPVVQTKLDQGFFGVRMGRLSPQERQYVRCMAELGVGPYRSGEIAEKMGMNSQQVASARARLMNKGIVWSGDFGETDFTVPLFDEYLRRNPPGLTYPSSKRATGKTNKRP